MPAHLNTFCRVPTNVHCICPRRASGRAPGVPICAALTPPREWCAAVDGNPAKDASNVSLSPFVDQELCATHGCETLPGRSQCFVSVRLTQARRAPSLHSP